MFAFYFPVNRTGSNQDGVMVVVVEVVVVAVVVVVVVGTVIGDDWILTSCQPHMVTSG